MNPDYQAHYLTVSRQSVIAYAIVSQPGENVDRRFQPTSVRTSSVQNVCRLRCTIAALRLCKYAVPSTLGAVRWRLEATIFALTDESFSEMLAG